DERQKAQGAEPGEGRPMQRRAPDVADDPPPEPPDCAEHALHHGVHRECDVCGGKVGEHRPRSTALSTTTSCDRSHERTPIFWAYETGASPAFSSRCGQRGCADVFVR